MPVSHWSRSCPTFEPEGEVPVDSRRIHRPLLENAPIRTPVGPSRAVGQALITHRESGRTPL